MLFVQHNTMESLLERGEKLDDLVAKSEHLGNQSKAFYKTVSVEEPAVNTGLKIWWLFSVSVFWPCVSVQARKQNSCCEIMWCRCFVDTPLSAFLLFLRPPSCTCHQLSTQRTERTPSPPGWGAERKGKKEWWPIETWPLQVVADGHWGSDGFGRGKK